MKLLRYASAGTENKQDVLVTAEPISGGNEILVSSSVKELYGDLITASAEELLAQLGVREGCRLSIRDFNALDFALRARIETALLRALGEEEE